MCTYLTDSRSNIQFGAIKANSSFSVFVSLSFSSGCTFRVRFLEREKNRFSEVEKKLRVKLFDPKQVMLFTFMVA